MLKLHDNKTEFLLLYSKNVGPLSITIGDAAISPSPYSMNLGVIIDDGCHDTLSVRPHISATCKSALFHLCRISCICKFLSSPSVKTLVHSFISRLPECDLHKLQCVQNAAVHLVTHTKKYEHVTLILMELYWLLVRHRILLKILVLTY